MPKLTRTELNFQVRFGLLALAKALPEEQEQKNYSQPEENIHKEHTVSCVCILCLSQQERKERMSRLVTLPINAQHWWSLLDPE